ncbi:MAG: BLUF domain-containing protein, partial [Nitrospinota bacterium]|nr:BLUF domain-containing protein [Nitrospinota bacterium]
MIQITYISSETRPMLQHDLDDILSRSRENNIEMGITGMLLYGNNTFIQILEGEERTVDSLLRKIRKDP